MSKEVIIRRAELQDVPKLAPLFDLYRQFYKRKADIREAEKFLSERIENKESVVFVAENSQGDLLGFTQLYPGFTSLGMARSWILNDLYVVQSGRRIGIGRLLMNAAHELACVTGAASINLETQVENTKAQSLYESLGYEAESGFKFYSKVVNQAA